MNSLTQVSNNSQKGELMVTNFVGNHTTARSISHMQPRECEFTVDGLKIMEAS